MRLCFLYPPYVYNIVIKVLLLPQNYAIQLCHKRLWQTGKVFLSRNKSSWKKSIFLFQINGVLVNLSNDFQNQSYLAFKLGDFNLS